MSGLKRLQSQSGSSTLVIGDGPTGLLFSRLLRLVGCTQVVLAGLHTLDRLSHLHRLEDLDLHQVADGGYDHAQQDQAK